MRGWRGSSYPADHYTLSHEGKELSDEITLESIYTPGEKLVLEVHSVSVYVEKTGLDGWRIPVTLEVSEIHNAEDIIRGRVYAVKGLMPTDQRPCNDRQDFTSAWRFSKRSLVPGSNVRLL